MSTVKYPHQSPELTQFYDKYRAWVEAGTPRPSAFSVNYGLCANVSWLAHNFELGSRINREELGSRIKRELVSSFLSAGLDLRYPFDDGKYSKYLHDYPKLHENPSRWAWVVEHSSTPNKEQTMPYVAFVHTKSLRPDGSTDKHHAEPVAVRVSTAPRTGKTQSGYGSKLPTQYEVNYKGYWRRVKCYCFSNSGTLYIGRTFSERLIVDITYVQDEE